MIPLRQSEPDSSRGCLYRLTRGLAICTGLLALAALSGYIAMLWSMEEDRVEVPRAVGLDSVAAGALVKESGLVPRVVAEEFSAHIPKGQVSSQRPSGGARVKLGSEVRLILSRGTDQLSVPNLADITLPQAKRILAETGLNLGQIATIHSDLHSRDMVIAQDPPAGSAATRGAEVRILQSLGPWEELVTLPDFRGREMVVALNLLKELQIEARISFRQAASKEGHVVAQDPAPGASVKVGGQVQLTIGE
jgi:eukaryotic-like serine/threonine-protein kinase